MKVNLVFDEDLLTVGDLIDLEEGSMSERIRILGKCVQNGQGEYLPEEEGLIKIRSMTLSQLKEAVEAFTEAASITDPK